jgi:hypothetical protein
MADHIGGRAMSFAVDAVREWANWPELPDVTTAVQCRYWRKLVSDVLAACDEIERLEGQIDDAYKRGWEAAMRQENVPEASV